MQAFTDTLGLPGSFEPTQSESGRYDPGALRLAGREPFWHHPAMGGFTSHIAVLTLDLHIPEAGSLKSKRQVVKSIKDRVRAKFNVSIAELGELEKWQRTILGVTMIGNDKQRLNSTMESIRALIEASGGVQLIDSHLDFI